MKNIISKVKYGVPHQEYKRIEDIWKENKASAIFECKLLGYKRLCQHLQQKL